MISISIPVSPAIAAEALAAAFIVATVVRAPRHIAPNVVLNVRPGRRPISKAHVLSGRRGIVRICAVTHFTSL